MFILQPIVSLSAFPKSGVTYLSFLLFHSLFSDDCNIHELELKYIIDIHAYPNARFANPQGPRLIKSHFPYRPDLPAVGLTKKAIYLIRDPIDVMMSVWDFERLIKGSARGTESAEFRAYVRHWLESGGLYVPEFGSWLQHVRSWLGQTAIPVHLVSYRNLVDMPEVELAAILGFLGITVPLDRQRIAIERSSMKSMAALETEEVEKHVEGIFFRNGLSAGYGMGHRFINKGYRNSYEAILTGEERAIADKTFGAELARYFRKQP
jgi:Sulfotransferase domain